MKIYYDKKNNEILIIADKQTMPTVTFATDYGKTMLGKQYSLHWASQHDGYSTSYTEKELKELMKKYPYEKVSLCKTVKKKVKINN